ncbi:hypothetical protein Cadr_000011767 [Camelus dromedarius]|uniref:Uncharacterized protein n=1 Tax=Camelus dromedarius TaxID=9838 RepID=A0A5N4DS63_CAMDR|nr:hypothetical protein Cadr_000011767 [Camelus dromedarius]
MEAWRLCHVHSSAPRPLAFLPTALLFTPKHATSQLPQVGRGNLRTTQVVILGEALGSDPESPAAHGLDSWGMGPCGCLHGEGLEMGRAQEERLRDEETENQRNLEIVLPLGLGTRTASHLCGTRSPRLGSWCVGPKGWGKAGIPGQQGDPPHHPIPIHSGDDNTTFLQVTPQFSGASYIFGVTPMLGTPPGSNSVSLTESPPTLPGLLRGDFGDSGIQAPSSFISQEPSCVGIPGPLPYSGMQPSLTLRVLTTSPLLPQT